MPDIAIRVERLGKKYRIGGPPAPYHTLRDQIVRAWAAPLRVLRRGGGVSKHRTFWALRDVSFEVKRGEAIGIVGRNGGGKSTLLKILSQITNPTAGEVDIYGRVGSLLEVGTGFHPELTGRENIYLNGAILGMRRREIARKFSEIVEFAEVEQFIDTPVKHYSSGMYMRLAFAVAAHLEPEILIVDEVLAVGDAAFQKKCLGKMQDAAKHGRTVCFVSHNMAAVLQICQRAIMIREGEIIKDGTAQEVVSCYLGEGRGPQADVCDFSTNKRPEWIGSRAELLSCRMLGNCGNWTLPFGSEITLEIRASVKQPLEHLRLGLALCTATGFEVASSASSDALSPKSVKQGEYVFNVSFPSLVMVPGQYYFGLGLRSERGVEDYLKETVWFEIMPTSESSRRLIHLRKGPVIPTVIFKLRAN